MAINTTRLATRLGHLLASLNEVNTYRGTTLIARVGTIEGDYTSVNPDLIGSLYQDRDSAITSMDSWIQSLSSRIEGVIVKEVLNDKLIPNPSLSNCLEEWIRQMKIAADTFQNSPCTIGSVTNVGSPTSATQWVTTAKDGTGVVQDLIVPDSYLLDIVADDQRGGTKYGETYSLVGKQADGVNTDYTYPTGYGLDTTKQILDPAVDKIALNSDFNTWTVANTPDNWTIASGVAGTNVFRVADDCRDGADGFCLRLLSTASGTLKLRQDITTSLTPNTVYGVHFKVKPVANGSATSSAVTVNVRLVDGSGTVIADDATTNNAKASSAHSVVTVGSGWGNGYQTVFITPSTLPSTVYLEITQISDAAGADDYIDHVSLTQLTPIYPGGPYLEGFSATVRAAQNDAWTWAVTLTTGVVSTVIVRGLDRFLDLKSLGMRLPTAGSPSQSDSLIT